MCRQCDLTPEEMAEGWRTRFYDLLEKTNRLEEENLNLRKQVDAFDERLEDEYYRGRESDYDACYIDALDR